MNRVQQVFGFALVFVGLLMLAWDYVWVPYSGHSEDSFIHQFVTGYHMPGLLAMFVWALLIFIGIAFARGGED